MTSEFPARNEIGSSARRGVGSPARVHGGCAVQDEARIPCTKPGRDRVHEGRSAYRPDARNRVGLGCVRPEGAARNQVGTFTNYHAKVTPKNSREFFSPRSTSRPVSLSSSAPLSVHVIRRFPSVRPPQCARREVGLSDSIPEKTHVSFFISIHRPARSVRPDVHEGRSAFQTMETRKTHVSFSPARGGRGGEGGRNAVCRK